MPVFGVTDSLPASTVVVGEFKAPMKRIFFIILFERAFKMIRNGVYFVVIARLVAKLFKIYAN